jgi:uncharacterized repeat protein (TIGR01451 family)
MALASTAEAQAILKEFDAEVIPRNGTTTVKLTITGQLAAGWTISDNLSTGLVGTASPALPAPTTTCSSGTPVQSTSTLAFTSGPPLASGDSCTITYTIKATAPGTYNNTARLFPVVGTQIVSSDSIIVRDPTFSKVFGASKIVVNGTTTLTFTVANNTTVPLANVGWNDDFSLSFFELVTIDSASAGCGTPAPTMTGEGTSMLSVSSVEIGIGESCIVQVTVKGTVGSGVSPYNNLAQGTGLLAGISAPAAIKVGPPVLTKSFEDSVVLANGETTMTIHIFNDTNSVLTNIGFKDPLSVFGLSALGPAPISNPCGLPVIITPPLVELKDATLQPGQSCDISVRIKVGTSSTTNVIEGVGDLAIQEFPANITVVSPTFTKTAAPTDFRTGTDTVFTLTIANNTGLTLNNASYTDTLPSGLTLLSATGGGCTPVVDLPNNKFTIGPLMMPSGTTCVVTATAKGTTGATAITVQNKAIGGGDLTGIDPKADVTVRPGPSLTKAFSPKTVSVGGLSTMTITVVNPATGGLLANASIQDNLPAGMTYDSTVAGSPSCTDGTNGTLTPAPNPLTWSRANMPAGVTCTIAIKVKGTATAENTVTGLGDLAGLSSKDTLTVGDVIFTKAFLPAAINLNAVTMLKFRIDNSAGGPLGPPMGFADNLQTLNLTSPNASFNPSVQDADCPGTVTVSGNIVNYNSTTDPLAAGAVCEFSIPVTGSSAGTKLNVAKGTGALFPKEAIDTLVVTGPITFTKTFDPPTVIVGGTSDLTFTITNNSGAALTNATFTDALFFNVKVDALLSSVNSCGGTVQAVPNTASISLAGPTNIPDGSTCTIVVRVRANDVGVKPNLAVGGGDLDGKTAPATLTVLDRQFTKSFSPSSVPVGFSPIRLTWNITNTNLTGPNVTAGFADPLPMGMKVANSPVNSTASASCGTGFTPANGAGTVNFSGASIAPGATCTVSVNVTVPGVGLYHNVADGTGYISGLQAIADLDVAPAAQNAYQLRYFSLLDRGESYIRITNSGASSTAVNNLVQNGNLCVNLYTFTPDEQLISCCSCVVTPNGLASVSVGRDLVANPLTPSIPTSVVVKLLASAQTGACNAGTVSMVGLRSGLEAWGNTLHEAPGLGSRVARTETSFHPAALSTPELERMTQLCALIQANGSGYGICRGCQLAGGR